MNSGKQKRRYYLSDIPLSEAIKRFHEALERSDALKPMSAETVALDEARGRITAEPVWAKISSPHYDASAMDGVAVRSKETIGATETAPMRLKLGDQAVWVDTGAPMPEGFDAVIMVEVVHEVDEANIEIQAAAAPYQHVRPLGEDIVATELVLPESHRLRPIDLGACAAAGLSELSVRRPPTVVLIPTGTELVPIGSSPGPGDIIEFNTLMLAGMVEEWGADASRWPAVPDDYERLRASVTDAVRDYDIVVVNAGSSAGSRDYTAQLVEELGELLVHGTAIRPGHPVVLGVVEDKPVLGIPGYPVSAVLTCELFVKPLIEMKLKATAPAPSQVSAKITRKVVSPIGEDEYLRVRMGRVGDTLVATPLQRGAGVIMSLVRADGFVLVPRFSEGLDTGDQVSVGLFRPLGDVENTIVAIGSHDMTLDLLANHLRRRHPSLNLSSSNVGSLGGLMALARGEAHIAGSHLLDEQTGEYNVAHVDRHLGDRDVVVMNLVRRIQGLIVARDNPKRVASLEDLLRDDLTFINRQRGSGTRVLLDYQLKELGIDASAIRGYNREEYTHLAVAATVAGGNADVGLGIVSAARALNVDFLPITTEQYDLVIPSKFYESDLLQPLLAIVKSKEFMYEVEALGGYDTSTMGRIVAGSVGRSA